MRDSSYSVQSLAQIFAGKFSLRDAPLSLPSLLSRSQLFLSCSTKPTTTQPASASQAPDPGAFLFRQETDCAETYSADKFFCAWCTRGCTTCSARASRPRAALSPRSFCFGAAACAGCPRPSWSRNPTRFPRRPRALQTSAPFSAPDARHPPPRLRTRFSGKSPKRVLGPERFFQNLPGFFREKKSFFC